MTLPPSLDLPELLHADALTWTRPLTTCSSGHAWIRTEIDGL